MRIAVLNQSKRLTDPQQIREMAVAINRQIALEVAPAWHRLSVPVVPYFDPALVPAGAWTLVIVDNPTVAGALGFHTEDSDRPGAPPRVHGFVFVDPVLDNGGTVLDGENSVAAVASHETCELFIDPNVQLWADNANGVAYAVEVCDACEADAYALNGLTRPVSVSNFLLPAWFDGIGAATHVDYLGKLSGPFTMDAGGYVSTLTEGTPQQAQGRLEHTWGDQVPAWKIEAHALSGSRHARREQTRR